MADVTAQVGASLDALTREFDIIAHNMANVNTTGFKRRCNSFTEVLEAQNAMQEDEDLGLFDFSQGSLVQTDRTLDLALHGDGFFMIESPEGPLYTRHGVFYANENGQIVDSVGRMVAGVAGPLIVPRSIDVSEIHVASDGRVHGGEAMIGQFRIVEFPDAQEVLTPAGQNCFQAPTDVLPVDSPTTAVRQGYKEASNVRMIDELVNMILVSRMYEANMKLIVAKRDATNSALGVAMG